MDVVAEFEDWIQGWSTPAPSTYQNSESLAFQRWFRFKEAFSPALVRRVIESLDTKPNHILDCFGGSGTTAVVAQMLATSSTSIEVNPFLADVIEAKLTNYTKFDIHNSASELLSNANGITISISDLKRSLPPTFIEPGVNSRWLFSRDAAIAIEQLRQSILKLASPELQRLFRVALGSILIEASNVRIDGKARRYRSNWQTRRISSSEVYSLFIEAIAAIAEDVSRFPINNKKITHNVYRGDSRKLIQTEVITPVDLAIFSPPYPNSFDYTDIYNVELWMLKYFQSPKDNKALRLETMRSHMQISWEQKYRNINSETLHLTIQQLNLQREKLWSSKIPDMVFAYFLDLDDIITSIRQKLSAKGVIAIIVGNSSYAGVTVDSGKILKEIAQNHALEVVKCESVRVMRTSSQQTAAIKALDEWLIILRRVRSA